VMLLLVYLSKQKFFIAISFFGNFLKSFANNNKYKKRQKSPLSVRY